MALITPSTTLVLPDNSPTTHSPELSCSARKEARGIRRCRRVAIRFEKFGMPMTIPAVTEDLEYSIIKLRALRSYGSLNDLRQAWRNRTESRLVVGSNVSSLLALVLLLGLRISGNNSFAGYACIAALNVVTFGCLAAMFTLHGFGLRIERDPAGFIARHHPDLLYSAGVLNQLWAKDDWTLFSSDDGYRAVAGLCAAGGVPAFPAEWLGDSASPSASDTALLGLFGITAWIDTQGLTKDEREVYDRLTGEFYGTLSELLDTARRLS